MEFNNNLVKPNKQSYNKYLRILKRLMFQVTIRSLKYFFIKLN